MSSKNPSLHHLLVQRSWQQYYEHAPQPRLSRARHIPADACSTTGVRLDVLPPANLNPETGWFAYLSQNAAPVCRRKPHHSDLSFRPWQSTVTRMVVVHRSSAASTVTVGTSAAFNPDLGGEPYARIQKGTVVRAVLDNSESPNDWVYLEAAGMYPGDPEDAAELVFGWRILGRPNVSHEPHVRGELRVCLDWKGTSYFPAKVEPDILPETKWSDSDLEVGGHPEDRHELTIIDCQIEVRSEDGGTLQSAVLNVPQSQHGHRRPRVHLPVCGPRIRRRAPLVPGATFGEPRPDDEHTWLDSKGRVHRNAWNVGAPPATHKPQGIVRAAWRRHERDLQRDLHETIAWIRERIGLPAITDAPVAWMKARGLDVDAEHEHQDITLRQRIHSLAPFASTERAVAWHRAFYYGDPAAAPTGDPEVDTKFATANITTRQSASSWVVYDNECNERLHIDIEDFAARNGDAVLDESIVPELPTNLPEQPEWIDSIAVETKAGPRRRASVPTWLRQSTPAQIAARVAVRLPEARKATHFTVSAARSRIHFFFST